MPATATTTTATTTTAAAPDPTVVAVTITTTDGVPVEVTGMRVGAYLAVTPAIGGHDARPGPGFTGRWAVTHVPTGRKIRAGIYGPAEACLHHATEFANRLAGTDIDWSAPRHVLADSDYVQRTCWELGHAFASCGQPAHCADPGRGGC
jgi:hypothetical protein